MELVLSTSSLAGLGGSESYLVTVADHLQRLGHGVWLHALEHGPASVMAGQLGVRTCGDPELPERPDALVVQDGVVAYEMARRYPSAPQLFVAHSDLFDLQLPPQLPDLVAGVVVLYERVDRRIRALATEHEIVRLTQPIDIDRFKPIRPLRPEPKVALTLSNYLHGGRISLLAAACDELGIELRQAGGLAPGGQRSPEVVLNEADIVFGKARVVYEAMACGRAAYVFDHNGGDGWVTASNFELLSADNFGGQSGTAAIDCGRLVADLAQYDPLMGTVNRDLVVANNSATKHVARLVEVLERIAPRRAPIDAPLKEMARLVRLHHRADAQAFLMHVETERLATRVHQLETELGRMQQEAAAAQADVHDLEAELDQTKQAVVTTRSEAKAAAADVDHTRRLLQELKTTRRWRLMQAALRPADRLRRRFRRGGGGRPTTRRTSAGSEEYPAEQ